MARFRSVLNAAPTAATSAGGVRVRWLPHARGRVVVPSGVKLELTGAFDTSAVLRYLIAIAGSSMAFASLLPKATVGRVTRRMSGWDRARQQAERRPQRGSIGRRRARQRERRHFPPPASRPAREGQYTIYMLPSVLHARFLQLWVARGDVACGERGRGMAGCAGVCGMRACACGVRHTPPVRWLCAVLWYDTNKMRCLRRL